MSIVADIAMVIVVVVVVVGVVIQSEPLVAGTDTEEFVDGGGVGGRRI